MPMRVTDTIRGPARGSGIQVLAAMIGPDQKDRDFVAAMVANAPLVGIDTSIAFAHTAQETATPEGGPYSSVRYNRDLNVAGIGIPSNDTPQPFPIVSGEAAALIYLTCLNRLVEGTRMEPATWIERMGEAAWRWITTVWAGHCAEAKAAGATVVSINDLCKHYRDASGEWQATWAWNENAGNEIVAWGNRLFPKLDTQNGGATPVPDAVTFGRVPRPAIIDAIVTKAGPGNGYDAVPPRLIVGACGHITDGDPGGDNDIDWYRRFFSVGGERARDALVDFVVDRAGRIGMLNDPYGTRAPWANGGSNGLEGDGPLFVRTLGVAAINSRLASIEHVGICGQGMTSAQMDASARLMAWLFDRANVPWDRFPLNPNVNCVTHLWHLEFALKECPCDGITDQTDEYQDKIRGYLKAGQVGAVEPNPVPPPGPVEPNHQWWPAAYQEAALRERFADLIQRKPDGTTETFFFDPAGVISNAWVARGAAERRKVEELPTPDDWFVLESEFTPRTDIVSFGRKEWVFLLGNDRAGGRWLI